MTKPNNTAKSAQKKQAASLSGSSTKAEVEIWSWRGFFYSLLLGLPWLLHGEITRILLIFFYISLVAWYGIISGQGPAAADLETMKHLLMGLPFAMGLLNSDQIFLRFIKPRSKQVGIIFVAFIAATYVGTPAGQHSVAPIENWVKANLLAPAFASFGGAGDTSWKQLTYSWDKNTKYWGFKNPTGEWVIEPKYFVYPKPDGFKRGRALVGPMGKPKPNTLHFINAADERVGPYFNDFKGRLRGGDLACVTVKTSRSNVVYGLVNPHTGAWVIKPDDTKPLGFECLYHKKADLIIAGQNVQGYYSSTRLKAHRYRVYGLDGDLILDKMTEKFIVNKTGYAFATKTLKNYRYCVLREGEKSYLPNRLYQIEVYGLNGKHVGTAKAEALPSRRQKCR